MTTFLSDIILHNENDIQFKNSAGNNAGKISQTGDDLVLSNAVGDILLGSGSDDVYIGDGTSSVDIRFEQNMAIFADSATTKTLTIGGSNTDLILESPTLNTPTIAGATTINNKLTFTTSSGYIIFDYETGETGEYASEVPLLQLDRSGSPVSILTRVTSGGAIVLGIDDAVHIAAGDTKSVIKSNVNYTAEQVIFSSESGFIAYGFPSNDTTWSNRNEFRFRSDSATAGDNGLYIGDGGNTQFIDVNRNLKNIGTISSGAITSTGQITGTELEGTSLDINGNADISGTLDVAGDITLGNRFNLGDDGVMTWGNSNNYGQLNWDGDYALISGQSSKGIKFRTNGSGLALTLDTSQNATFTGDVTVSGDLTVSGTTVTVDTTNLNVQDKNITLNYSTGDSSSTADGAGITIQDAVNSTTDATILWDATNDKFDFSHGILLPDSKTLQLGSSTGSGDLQLVHDGTNSYIKNHVGNLYIYNQADDKDIIFQSDDGAGGITEYFRLDGGDEEVVFSKDARLPSFGKLYLWTGHDLNYLRYDLWTASASAGITIQNTSADGEIYLRSGNALTLTLDDSQNATFEGKLQVNQQGNGTSNLPSPVAVLSGQNTASVVKALSLVNSVTAASGNGTQIAFHNASNYSPTGTITTIQDGDVVTDSKMEFQIYNGGLQTALTIDHDSNATFAGSVTADTIVINDTDSTRGVFRNDAGYDLRLGGGTVYSDGAYISLSGGIRGGGTSNLKGRIEMRSGGSNYSAQTDITGDIVIGTQWNGGSSDILTLDSSTNAATFAGDVVINKGTTATATQTFRRDTSGDAAIIGDINFSTSAAEGTDDRVGLIRTSTQGGTSTTRGGIMYFFTRGANSSSFNTTSYNHIGSWSFPNDVTIAGDLTVNGTTVTVDTTNLNVQDKNITLNYSTGDSSSTADGAGITIQDAVNSDTDATILWTAASDRFDFSHQINVTGAITSSGTITADTYFQSSDTSAVLASQNNGSVFLRPNGIGSGTGAFSVSSSGKATVSGELEATSLDINGVADISGALSVAGNATFTADVYVHHNDGLQLGDTGNNSTARTTLTSFADGGNSRMKIKGGNFIHSLRLETSKNDFQYADFNSSYNGSDTTLNLHKSNSDTTGTDATTTISTGTSTFAGDVILSSTAPTLRIQDSRNLNNPDWDNVSLGNIEFYTSDTTSPGARVLAEIEAFSNATAASGPNADLIFKTSEQTDSSPQTRLTIGHNGVSTFAGDVTVGSNSLTAGSLDINGSADISGTLNLHDEIITTAAGSLFEVYKSSWTTTNHDILYQGWDTTVDDYIYLKAPGNTTTTHGIALIGDNVIAFGRTNVETGSPELTSAAAPLNDNWLVLNSTGATFAGTVTVGADDTGHDVIFYGATSGRYLHWDESQDRLELRDNVQIAWGSGIDFTIVHDGTDSKITNSTGDLVIRNLADDKDIIFQSDDGAGDVATYFFLDGSGTSELTTTFPDNSKAGFGNGNDLRLWHDGGTSYINNYTGTFKFYQHVDDGDMIFYCDDGSGGATPYITLDGSEGHTVASKEINFSDGIPATFGNKAGGDLEIKEQSGNSYISNFTGNLEITNHTDDGDIIFKSDDGSGGVTTYFSLDGSVGGGSTVHTVFPDNSKAVFGTGLDLQIYHDASNSYIKQQGGGDLYIQQTTDDKDIIFQSDNGSGGLAEYIRLDGSTAKILINRPTIFYDTLTIPSEIIHSGDTDTKIAFGTNTVTVTAGNVSNIEASATGASIPKRKFGKSGTTDGDHDGDVVYFGSTTSMEVGAIYFLNSSGNWQLADADAESTCNGMLGVALGSASDTDGVLIRGFVTLNHDPGTISNALFVSTTAGQATATAPSGNGDIVRVIGYCLDSTNGQIYFNPAGTYVEVTA